MTREQILEALEAIDDAICDRCNQINYRASSRLSRVRDYLDIAREFLDAWEDA